MSPSHRERPKVVESHPATVVAEPGIPSHVYNLHAAPAERRWDIVVEHRLTDHATTSPGSKPERKSNV